MTKEEITEAVTLITLMEKLTDEERRRFLYMIEGAAVVAKNRSEEVQKG